jgi:post-segregation antitoxin (ccd killing protein)
MLCNTMTVRLGKTVTFSISVDPETQRILKQEAKRSYNGNVSALVASIAKEAKRQAAFDWLLQGHTPMTETRKADLLAEIDGVQKRRRRVAA